MDIEALVKSRVRDVKDYPKQGILFRDITPLLADGSVFSAVIDALAEEIPKGTDVVVGVEARGFIIGAALAHRLGIGFVPIRKRGKLPYNTVSIDYELEYGSASIEVHEDAFSARKGAVIIDDLLATGGTAAAAKSLVKRLGGNVLAFASVVELADLNGRAKLEGTRIISLAKY